LKKNWFEVRAEYFVAAALVAALRWLPRSAAESLGSLAARLLDRAIPRLRRIARQNLRLAFPELDARDREAIIDGVFQNIGRLLLAVARFPSLSPANLNQWISYEGLENYQAAKQAGHGVLVATAHLGNWELSAFSHALMTEPMNVMVRPLDNPLIDTLLESRRTLSGNRLIFKKDAARSVLRALKNNEAVGILIDQNTSASEGVFVNFFGVPACTASGLARIALRTDAAVVPGFTIWDPVLRKYRLRFDPAVNLVRTGDDEKDIVTNTQVFTKITEDYVRRYPDQWLWVHRRWKTRPPGEAGLY